ncbi:MAG: hypothetical protein KAJ14_16300 [Candidatus Omnitrophica bacterium]|nr:hypothetical protein [Candidatus Omnitrophota bacterium]
MSILFSMKLNKDEILNIIDKKISLFQKISSEATYENKYGEEYDLAYYGTKNLIHELYSEKESQRFANNTQTAIAFFGDETDYYQELKDYKDHINRCISQLKVYRERVETFGIEEPEIMINWPLLKSKLQPLVMALKKFKSWIILLLILLSLIAGTINDWQTVSEFINSTLK